MIYQLKRTGKPALMPGYNDTSRVKENIPKTESVVLRLSCRVANFTRFALYNLNVPENILHLGITRHVFSHETHLISGRKWWWWIGTIRKLWYDWKTIAKKQQEYH